MYILSLLLCVQVLGYKHYSLAGWSDGGNTAMILAAKRPQNVQKLATWGGNSYCTENDLKAYEGKVSLVQLGWILFCLGFIGITREPGLDFPTLLP